jgi:hypothetical protein
MEKKVELTELFMAQADKNRCFFGIIKRWKDEKGNPLVFSEIKINDGYIYSQESDQDKLGKNLDELVILVLDGGLHKSTGVSTKICDTPFFHN